MEYQDFSIWITPAADGTYQVKAETLERGPGGPIVRQTAKATLELPEELQLDRVGGLLAGLARSIKGDATADSNGGSDNEPHEIELRDIVTEAQAPPGAGAPGSPPTNVLDVGNRLYRALINGPVKELYDRSLNRTLADKELGLRIRLNLDLQDAGLRELSRLPWEFLNSNPERNDKGFLNLSVETPLVRDLEISQPRAPLPFEQPLRVLVVIANPPGSVPLDLEGELRTIEETFVELREAGAVELTVLPHATREKLFDMLDEKQFHVLHYMGHGDFNEGEGSGLLLMEGANRDERHVSSGTLALILQDHADTVRLVFLNACKTATTTGEGDVDPYGGVAASLIETGIAAVVAMQFPISDTAATLFSKKFYQRIAGGKPVDTAVAMARKYLQLEMPSTNHEWATPVLFMRSADGILFEAGPPADPGSVVSDPGRAAPDPGSVIGPSPGADSAVPVGVDLNADFAVWLANEGGHLVLHWRASAPGSRDFVALFRSPPEDNPAGYVADAYEYASREGSYPTGEPAAPGYWIAYVAEDARGKKTIRASWGPTT